MSHTANPAVADLPAPLPEVSLPVAHDDKAYTDYVTFCVRMDVKPLRRELWDAFTGKYIGPGGVYQQ
jgi:hypothetical protein